MSDSSKTRLSRKARAFQSKVEKTYTLEAHHKLLLQSACGCLDRIDSARSEVAKAGEYYVDRWGQPREHPGLKVERDQKILFARLMRELCLDGVEPGEVRPPRTYGG
jgi:hypothetical protein